MNQSESGVRVVVTALLPTRDAVARAREVRAVHEKLVLVGPEPNAEMVVVVPLEARWARLQGRP
jgi:hypothetical protein